MTLNGLTSRFPDEEACRAHFFKLRWPNGKVTCPRCGEAKKVYARKAPYRWICKACNKNGYGFSLTSRTVFADTKYGLKTWFMVLFLMLNAKKGKSALEIKRLVFDDKASYETVWYMCHRLRAAMKDPHFQQLAGEVEVDSTRAQKPLPADRAHQCADSYWRTACPLRLPSLATPTGLGVSSTSSP